MIPDVIPDVEYIFHTELYQTAYNVHPDVVNVYPSLGNNPVEIILPEPEESNFISAVETVPAGKVQFPDTITKSDVKGITLPTTVDTTEVLMKVLNCPAVDNLFRLSWITGIPVTAVTDVVGVKAEHLESAMVIHL